MWSVFGNAIMAFGMAVTLCFTMGDTESLLSTTYGLPFVQLFYNAVQSKAGVNAMLAIIIFMSAACTISEVATASRQLWSFARDQGMPFSDWLSVVSAKTRITRICILMLEGATWLESTRPLCTGFIHCSMLDCMHQHRFLSSA